MKKQTIAAIQTRLDNGETRFFIGRYYYECNVNGMIRRREQRAGYAPITDWERIGSWRPAAWTVDA